MFPRLLLTTLATLTLAACAGQAPRESLSPEEAITQRTTERWQYIIKGDFKSAYEYLTPGSRKVMSYEEYAQRLRQAQIKWTGTRVNKVTCEDAETCRAEVELDILVVMPGTSINGGQIATKTLLQENWLASGGRWYYLPSQAR